MTPAAVKTAWYRTVVSWRRQWSSYVVLVVLIGLAGGVALGSLAAARRTASSFPAFLAASNPSDLQIDPAGSGPNGPASAHLQSILRAVRSYPEVKRVESYVGLPASLVENDRVERRALNSDVVLVGSVDGLLFNQDRFAIISGRMADPARADEVMVTENAAAAMGLHLGSQVPVAIPTGTASNAARRITLQVVGIGLLNREVVQDQIAKFPTYIVATPALTRSVGAGQLVYLGVQLRGGAADVAAVERRWNSSQQYFTDFQVASQVEAEAQQSIRPEALALGVFGGIAALATLLLAMQVIARVLGARAHDLAVMRAVGADPATTELDGLIGIVASAVAGSVLAVGVAFALSPLFPIGPVRPVYPDPGPQADWTVLGLGCAVLVGALVMVTMIITVRDAPHRALRRSRLSGHRSSTVQVAARSGLPPSAVAGASLAVDARNGRPSGPYRWSLLSAVIAMLVVTTTLTFGASLHTLVSRPALYGWNWDDAVQSSDGYGPVPNKAVADVRHDSAVQSFSGVWFVTMQLDGVEVPTLLAAPGSLVGPPIVAGRGLATSREIVLGQATLAQLHKHIGDTVDVQYVPGYPRRPIRLTIAGIATMPAIGIAEGLHTSMGIGALMPADAGPVTESLGPQGYAPSCNGPNMVLLRVRDGLVLRRSSQRHSACRMRRTRCWRGSSRTRPAAAMSPRCSPCSTRPRSSTTGPWAPRRSCWPAASRSPPSSRWVWRSWPRCDGADANLPAQGARVHTAPARCDRCRNASFAAAVGVVVGIPLGVVVGRWLWILFAEEIGAVPAPTVPVWSVFLVALAAFVLANAAAFLPGRRAARTAAALVLRDE